VTPPRSGQDDQPFPTTNLTAHDNNFEPMVEILSGQIKGQDLAPYEIKYPSSLISIVKFDIKTGVVVYELVKQLSLIIVADLHY